MRPMLFKAEMNIDIPLETAASSHIFLKANLFSKQGISSEYVIVDFICLGLFDLWGERTENYKMKNSCPQWDSNPGLSAYETDSLRIALLVEISIKHLNFYLILSEYDIEIYLYHVQRSRCSNFFCRILHFINSLRSANKAKHLNDTNIIWQKYTTNHFAASTRGPGNLNGKFR